MNRASPHGRERVVMGFWGSKGGSDTSVREKAGVSLPLFTVMEVAPLGMS